MQDRKIKKITKSIATTEGAGVHLKRVFGFNELPDFDPFLLLDDFRSDDPSKYQKGFPWHPHRGIETITYILKGKVEHADSIGNKGIISSGDVQWMTAGSGIIHQEMPLGDDQQKMYGFQLWSNLPATYKMIAPRYQEIKSTAIPITEPQLGVKVKVICGFFNNIKGPVTSIISNPEFMDVHISPNTTYIHPTKKGNTCCIYIYDGSGFVSNELDLTKKTKVENENLIHFDDGDQIILNTTTNSINFLFLSGKPLREPIAWHGPIVMNTNEEIEIAINEYNNGSFIK